MLCATGARFGLALVMAVGNGVSGLEGFEVWRAAGSELRIIVSGQLRMKAVRIRRRISKHRN